MSVHEVVRRNGVVLVLGACLLSSAWACGARQVQLLFSAQNASGEYWVCSRADEEAKPEHRQPRCEKHPGGFLPEVGNSGRPVRVDVVPCGVGEYQTITIIDPDTDHPKAYVTCGQSMGGSMTPDGGLDGDVRPEDDLNGGLPPPSSSEPATP
ncbi:MAG: hypothetical protein RL685_3064 [Pseudomonadota bacterium]|jgi:hypothetical protein